MTDVDYKLTAIEAQNCFPKIALKDSHEFYEIASDLPGPIGVSALKQIVSDTAGARRKGIRLLRQCMKARCKRGNELSRVVVLQFREEYVNMANNELQKLLGVIEKVDGHSSSYAPEQRVELQFLIADLHRYLAEINGDISPWYPNNDVKLKVLMKEGKSREVNPISSDYVQKAERLYEELSSSIDRLPEGYMYYFKVRLIEAQAQIQRDIYRNKSEAVRERSEIDKLAVPDALEGSVLQAVLAKNALTYQGKKYKTDGARRLRMEEEKCYNTNNPFA